jgi:hypothetical protein
MIHLRMKLLFYDEETYDYEEHSNYEVDKSPEDTKKNYVTYCCC